MDNKLSIKIDDDLNLCADSALVEKIVVTIVTNGTTVWPEQEVRLTNKKINLKELRASISPIPIGSYKATIQEVFLGGGKSEECQVAFLLNKEQVEKISAPKSKKETVRITLPTPPKPINPAPGAPVAKPEKTEQEKIDADAKKMLEEIGGGPLPEPMPAPTATPVQKPAPKPVETPKPSPTPKLAATSTSREINLEELRLKRSLEEERKEKVEAEKRAEQLALQLAAAQKATAPAMPNPSMVNFQKKLDELAAKLAWDPRWWAVILLVAGILLGVGAFFGMKWAVTPPPLPPDPTTDNSPAVTLATNLLEVTAAKNRGLSVKTTPQPGVFIGIAGDNNAVNGPLVVNGTVVSKVPNPNAWLSATTTNVLCVPSRIKLPARTVFPYTWQEEILPGQIRDIGIEPGWKITQENDGTILVARCINGKWKKATEKIDMKVVNCTGYRMYNPPDSEPVSVKLTIRPY